MIIGIGVDAVRISRMEGLSSVRKFLSDFEIEQYNRLPEASQRNEYAASRFAAKEAIGKAFGTGIGPLTLSEITIASNSEGKPDVQIEGRTLELLNSRVSSPWTVHLSITHEEPLAIAFAVAEALPE